MIEDMKGLIMTSLNPEDGLVSKKICIELIKSNMKVLNECNIKIPKFFIDELNKKVYFNQTNKDFVLLEKYIEISTNITLEGDKNV